MFARIELAKRNFWIYCHIREPEFYAPSRFHLIELCDTLQNLYDGKLINEYGIVVKKLMINYPPQFGKTRTLINFCQWMLGKNNEERIISSSYNDFTAMDFSKFTRNGILEIKNLENQIVFSDIFPQTKIKYGDSGQQRWALEGQHFNFLSSGVGGSLTSKGATILIIDDPIKNAEDALNKNNLEKLWLWYVGTFLSRVSAKEGEPLEILNHTRWSGADLCGRILSSEDNKDWFILRRKAYDEDEDKELCHDILSKKVFLKRKAQASRDLNTKMIFTANYEQEIFDKEGALYQNIKTYLDLPEGVFKVKNYTDTADTGKDYLCSICYMEYKMICYIIDVYHTDEPNEITEQRTAKMLYENDVNLAKIESNNGGRAFARNVQRILKDELGSNKTVITWFHQSDNKEARINANSSWVQENIYFPVNWMDLWPKFHDHVITYQRKGKNAFDDAPDALTGIAEQTTKKKKILLH